ncbi:transglycosylase family protein [Capillimicrobium parvum]|uniref:Resuscitation-promoting factor core lysozyme-like domain-containing protein n=1 Tax=Capillimicrobium parvum TaxID=2884022 RepID=A0A9E6XXJ2_9ACTN|nr:transglycosylase family protein [Capillimicrobium parvum]UGS36206.1 hypothetical protein DSM104329_02606 [Capillimicrobium parvum]
MSTRALAALTAAAAAGTPTAIAFAADAGTPAPATPATAAARVAPDALTPRFAGERTLRQQMRSHVRDRLVAQYERTARRHDHKPKAAATTSWSNRRLRNAIHDLRRPPKPKPAPAPAAGGGGGPTGHLAAIAQCESGGDPRAIGGGGTYRGMYQFSYATWQAVGGSGDPAAASVAEQTRRAEILYAQAGPGQWPVCGQ